MECAVPIRPKPVVKPAPQVPSDAESWAMFLLEHVPPTVRRELGQLLMG
jgi:hypothetical protein